MKNTPKCLDSQGLVTGLITIRLLTLEGEETYVQESWAKPEPDGSTKLLPLDRG